MVGSYWLVPSANKMRNRLSKDHRGPLIPIFFLLATQVAFGQTESLTLSSGTAAANGTVSLSLALTSPAGSAPAALQWTLTYPTSNVLTISATAGLSATNAGKTLSCSAGLGVYTCSAWGMNANTIQNGTIAIVNLTIAAGVTSTSVAIGNTVAASSAGGSLALSATGGTVSGPKLSAPTLTSLSCNPTSLASGTSAICTVQLSQAAPAGGVAVSLACSNALLPGRTSTITVPAGSATATFSISAGTIASNQSATLIATLNGVSQTANIGLAAVVVSSLACSSTILASGASATCTVKLSQVAPAGGVAVSLACSNALLPGRASTITVPAGSATAAFSITAGNIASNQSATLFATLNGLSETVIISLVHQSTGGVSAGIGARIDGPPFSSSAVQATGQAIVTSSRTQGAIAALSCTPRAVSPGGQVTCNLEGTASSTALELQLASSSEQVRIPAVVATRPNQSSLTFQALVDPLARQQSVLIAATLGNSRAQDVVVVLPAAGPVLTMPGKQLAKFGTSVGFVVSAADQADLPVQLAAAGLPVGASFDPESGRFNWVPDASQQGKYVIAFTATNSAHQSSSAAMTIEVDAGAPALTPLQTLVCSPNAIATLKGTWLAPPESDLSELSVSAMELAGVRVKINGQAVPVLYRSEARVDFLCPSLDVGTKLSVVVETPAGLAGPLTATMTEASPMILSLDRSGQNQGALSFADNGDLVTERDFRLLGHPAQPGDDVLIWATGLGGSGGTSAALLVTIGEAYARIESVQPVAGHEGLQAVRVRVPATTTFGDAVPVQLQALTSDGRQVVSNVVTAAVEPVRQ
jgi:uncharacterized protein (TIGR03437 family)